MILSPLNFHKLVIDVSVHKEARIHQGFSQAGPRLWRNFKTPQWHFISRWVLISQELWDWLASRERPV